MHIRVLACTRVDTDDRGEEMRRSGGAGEDGEGHARGCEVIICVCFERWMNGVKIALICRGTVLPSGLMSVPG